MPYPTASPSKKKSEANQIKIYLLKLANLSDFWRVIWMNLANLDEVRGAQIGQIQIYLQNALKLARFSQKWHYFLLHFLIQMVQPPFY